jgi:pimeloyl-ACP methyl ester carboxylesterase
VTVCLVHGKPETAAVWNRLAPLLDRGPVVRLAPPGFGAPVPPGFAATMEEYGRWPVTELVRFGQPVLQSNSVAHLAYCGRPDGE